jgi:translation initiation factor 2 beta subunit (eIF-2beta)/eIF-5
MTPLKEKQKISRITVSLKFFRDKRQKKIDEYNKSPKFCLECNNPIDFEKKRKQALFTGLFNKL